MKKQYGFKLGQMAMASLLGLSLLTSGKASASTSNIREHSGSRGWSQTAVELLNTSSIVVDGFQTMSISIPNGRFAKVHKLIVQAEGVGRDTTVEVITNGDVKGTLYLPGRDPSYVVTIGEVTRSIEFRNTTNTRARIRSVVAYVTETSYEDRWNDGYYEPIPSMDLRARNEAAALAKKAIVLVDQLDKYTNYADYGRYLLPVKKAAARAYSTANARGSLSAKVREQLFALMGELELSKPFIEDAFERSAAFELAIELLSLRERLEHVLR
jgi:hypothetical protein